VDRANKGQTAYITVTVYDDETGFPVFQHTYLNGVLQSPPDDSPAYVLYDDLGRVREMIWHDSGSIGRVGGPATIKLNPENGIHILESYVVNSVRTRSATEPAVIVRDPQSGKTLKCEYYLNGKKLPAPDTPSLEK
jgi:hypothetical protein